MCRTGGEATSFHCDTCQTCYDLEQKDSHECKPARFKDACPICLMDMEFSRDQLVILNTCGHSLHDKCLENYLQMGDFKCPLCRSNLLTDEQSEEMMKDVYSE